MNDKPENPPAFPVDQKTYQFGKSYQLGGIGMTLRDYFAAQSIAGMFSGPWPDYSDHPEIAKRAYHFADTMLAQRCKAGSESSP